MLYYVDCCVQVTNNFGEIDKGFCAPIRFDSKEIF
jgi:hypothetical protein